MVETTLPVVQRVKEVHDVMEDEGLLCSLSFLRTDMYGIMTFHVGRDS